MPQAPPPEADPRLARVLADYFDLAADAQRAVLAQIEIVTLDGGEWLFRHGDAGDALYLLVRGRLQAWLERDAAGPLETPRLLGTIAPGESVGEIALLTGEARGAGIRASRDSLLLRVTRDAFERLAHQHPSLGLRLAGRAAALVGGGHGSRGSTRMLSTVTLLPLDQTGRSASFCERLVEALGRFGDIPAIGRADLERLGAPAPWPADLPEPPPGLAAWLHGLEGRHRLVTFRAEADDTAWASFVMRQSDLVVLIGEAGRSAGLRDAERLLGTDRADAALRRALVLLHDDDTGTLADTAAWYRDRPLEFHLHVRGGRRDDVNRVARVLVGRATGLVLGAGASRGFAHLGVYRALDEAGIPVDWVAGTSIGAIIGAAIAADWGPQHAINVVRAAFVGGKPFSDYTVPLVSLLSGRRMRRLIGRHMNRDIEDLPLPFFCLSSRLDDGTLNLHRTGSLARALRASASMPGILPPTVVDGHLAVDGSVLNSLPVDPMWQQPVGRVIAVSLASSHSRPVRYEETPGAWSILGGKLLPFRQRHRVPSLASVLLKSTELATLRQVQEQGDRASLLLRPEVGRFGLTEVKAFDRIVEAGYRCAVEALSGWPDPKDA